MGKYGQSLYMGGLSERVRTRDIEDFFRGYGKIVDISLKAKYGFIEFEDQHDAEDAVRDLDDKKLQGERVKLEMSKGCKDKYRDFQRSGRVRYRSFSREVSPGRRRYRSSSRGKGGGGRSRSRSRSPRGGGGRGGFEKRRTFYDKPAYRKYGAPEKTKWTVEVDNLSSRCSWQDLKDFMRKAGEVTYGDAHGEIGKNRGVVCYEREEDMKRSVEDLDGREINQREVKLTMKIREEWASANHSGGGGGHGGGRSRSRSRSRGRRSRSRSGSRGRGRSRSRSNSPKSDKSDGRKSRSRSGSPDRKRRKSRSPSSGKDRRSRSGSR